MRRDLRPDLEQCIRRRLIARPTRPFACGRWTIGIASGSERHPVIAHRLGHRRGESHEVAGCDGYIAKPLAYKEFLTTIAAELGKRAVVR
ncbi:MAG TPA: hypothetical protein VEK37_04755 [Gemmatimonadaceae bacterium]|nr:hypothetical protein [Gemmatimonadaceae bacterium]